MDNNKANSSILDRDIKNLIVSCEIMLDELKRIKRRRYYRKYYLSRKKKISDQKKKVLQKNLEKQTINNDINQKEYILYFD